MTMRACFTIIATFVVFAYGYEEYASCDDMKAYLQSTEEPVCKCFSAGHRDALGRRPTWIGCEKTNMFPIVNLLSRIPNTTHISKLFIWDCAMPKVPAALLLRLRPTEVNIETSTVREFDPALFNQLGGHVKVLTLKNNEIKKISVDLWTNLSALEHFDLSGNNLTALTSASLGKLEKLQSLALQRNNISSIGDGTFEFMGDLRQLSLSNNRLTHITADTFKGLGNLRNLQLEDNRLEYIDPRAFDHMPLLKNLNLGGNRLKGLSLPNLPQLQVLLVHANRLESLARVQTTAPLTALTTFYADGNAMTAVEEDDLASMPALITLSLNYNRITTVHQMALVHTPLLKSLSVEHNDLGELPDQLFHPVGSLTNLQLSNNSITEISDSVFKGLRSLQKLVLSYNHITSFSRRALSGVPQLKKLYLDHNRISRLENGTFDYIARPGMHTVDVSSNPWQCDCQLSWLAVWLVEHKALTWHVDTTYCHDKSEWTQLVATMHAMNCPAYVDPLATGSSNVWLTVIGTLLAVASLVMLTAIAAIYAMDYRRGATLFSRRYDLRRVPSDMVNLIGGGGGHQPTTKTTTMKEPTSPTKTGTVKKSVRFEASTLHKIEERT